MTGPIRVLVTGGRAYVDRARVFAELDTVRRERGIALVIEGGQRRYEPGQRKPVGGADHWASEWARSRGVPCARVDAYFDTLGKAAGPIRNGWMIDLLKPDLVVGFPGGTGTAGCLALARAAGVEVREVTP